MKKPQQVWGFFISVPGEMQLPTVAPGLEHPLDSPAARAGEIVGRWLSSICPLFWCVPASPVPPQAAAAVYGTRMIVAAGNDYFGTKAFHTLDVKMVKEFRIQNGYPTSGPQGVPPGTPASPEDLASPGITRGGGGSSTQ